MNDDHERQEYAAELRAKARQKRKEAAEYPPVEVDESFSEAENAEITALHGEIVATMLSHADELERAAENALQPPKPLAPEEKARRDAFVSAIIEEAKIECPPAFTTFDDLPLDERIKKVLLALRRADRKAALGILDESGAKTRGYLRAEIDYLTQLRTLGQESANPPRRLEATQKRAKPQAGKEKSQPYPRAETLSRMRRAVALMENDEQLRNGGRSELLAALQAEAPPDKGESDLVKALDQLAGYTTGDNPARLICYSSYLEKAGE